MSTATADRPTAAAPSSRLGAVQQPRVPQARLGLLGGQFDPVTPRQVMDFIAGRVADDRKGVVANHNLHSLYLLRRQPALQGFFDLADLIQIDSVPLIAWGRLLGQPVQFTHRSTYLDWREDFWSMACEKGWRVFLLGSAPGVADTTAQRLRARWPEVSFGSHHGYFDHDAGSCENSAVVDIINAFRPDVVLVAMGMPIQEMWIAQNATRLDRGVLLSVGGALDYEAGVQLPAPRWVGRLGLEWLFRFAVQPRRLFTRYFIEPWSLIEVGLDDVRAVLRSERRPGR